MQRLEEKTRKTKKQLAAWCSQGRASHCTRGLDSDWRSRRMESATVLCRLRVLMMMNAKSSCRTSNADKLEELCSLREKESQNEIVKITPLISIICCLSGVLNALNRKISSIACCCICLRRYSGFCLQCSTTMLIRNACVFLAVLFMHCKGEPLLCVDSYHDTNDICLREILQIQVIFFVHFRNSLVK